jgi:hypothetical protein
MEMCARGAKSFGALLRDRRRRLDPQSRALGDFERHPWRIGKPVTQEEVAEAAGVTRVWYGMLEGRAEVNASMALLGRLADILMFNGAQRIALFHAAIHRQDVVNAARRKQGILANMTWQIRILRETVPHGAAPAAVFRRDRRARVVSASLRTSSSSRSPR